MKALVGAIGFEPTTPCAQGRCATRLRYAPTCTARLILEDLPFIFHSRPRFQGPDCARTVHECGYCVMTVHIGAGLAGTISFARRLSFSKCFALHLQLHLRILLEDLRVALAKHLRYPLIGYASGT